MPQHRLSEPAPHRVRNMVRNSHADERGEARHCPGVSMKILNEPQAKGRINQ